MKEYSVSDYAKLRGVTRQAVSRNLRKGLMMPGVAGSRKIAGVWILSVDMEQVVNRKGE